VAYLGWTIRNPPKLPPLVDLTGGTDPILLIYCLDNGEYLS
jgi:hypothetical protein